MLSSVCRVSTTQGTWSTARLSVARYSLAATSVGNVAVFAGGQTRDTYDGRSDVVDFYNSETGTWTTAQLSVGRSYLAATSVGNVAFFAGGIGSNCSLAMFCVWFLFVLDLLCV
jgi:hypothetical protein